MPNLYSSLDTSTWIYQPNFVRSRARWRGPRESYKLNLDMTQLLYDFRKLYEKFDNLDESLNQNLTGIEWGASFNATYVWGGAAEATLVMPGLDDLTMRIERLKQRVTTLERGV